MDGLREIIRDLGQHADSAWHYFRRFCLLGSCRQSRFFSPVKGTNEGKLTKSSYTAQATHTKGILQRLKVVMKLDRLDGMCSQPGGDLFLCKIAQTHREN
jgi:hypothetical protein